MKKVYILVLNILFITNLGAQEIDLVSVGASYAEQTYYTIESGATMSHANETWDIAFRMGPGNYGISINEAVAISFGHPHIIPLSGTPHRKNEIKKASVKV